MNFDPRLEQQLKEHPYPLLFATISGSHIYGFPSPDSDYDLRGVHILPLETVIGLRSFSSKTTSFFGIRLILSYFASCLIHLTPSLLPFLACLTMSTIASCPLG